VRRLGFITDVHADVHALTDALAQMDRMGCDAIVCGGDLIDYGLFPSETIALLRTRKIPCVRGNHDRWAVGRGRADAADAEPDDQADDASGWDLSRKDVAFLAGLPKRWEAKLEGVRVAVHHASPRSDMDGIVADATTLPDARRWLEQAEADVLLVGHTHRAFAMETPSGAIIANPGALLRDPADDFRERAMIYDPDARKFVAEEALPTPGTFGILELPAKRFTVHRARDGAEVEIARVSLGFTRSWKR
jgi:predicted phosphodiesterase